MTKGTVTRMIYTPKTKQALKLCFEAHKNQVDKSGMPYVFHPFHVAEQMKDETSTIVALLHDTPYTMENIAAMDFGDEVMDTLALLTHDEAVPYLEYVAALRSNPVAREVKIADLKHNSDPTRLDALTPKDERRVLKYRMAAAILSDDYYDDYQKTFRKTIPLDLDRWYFLSIFYNEHRIQGYSLDVEAADDYHYQFSDAAPEILKRYLPTAESFPEALAIYLSSHTSTQFAMLLTQKGLLTGYFAY